MKKLLALFIAVALCLTFAGCVTVDESPVKDTGANNNETKPTEQKKELTFGINETAAFSTLKITANEIKQSEGDGFFVPEAGKVFVGVKFTIENISDEEQTISSLLMFEGYVNDVKCAYSFNAACAFDEGTLDGSLAPGKKLVGWYALEVPADWSTIELDVQHDILSNNPAKFVFTK